MTENLEAMKGMERKGGREGARGRERERERERGGGTGGDQAIEKAGESSPARHWCCTDLLCSNPASLACFQTVRHRTIQLTEVKLLAMVSKPLLAEVRIIYLLVNHCSRAFQ